MFSTERLEARLPEPEDVPEVVRFYNDNWAHLERWSPASPPGFFTEPYWHDQVVVRRREAEEQSALRLFLFPRARPHLVVGNLSLTQIVRGALQSCTVGYSLAAAEQGKGYMLEAVEGAVGFAFKELGLHRVVASYMPHNRRSARVLRQAGFRVEGYFTSYLLIHGRWEDHVHTTIVNPAQA